MAKQTTPAVTAVRFGELITEFFQEKPEALDLLHNFIANAQIVRKPAPAVKAQTPAKTKKAAAPKAIVATVAHSVTKPQKQSRAEKRREARKGRSALLAKPLRERLQARRTAAKPVLPMAQHQPRARRLIS